VHDYGPANLIPSCPTYPMKKSAKYAHNGPGITGRKMRFCAMTYASTLRVVEKHYTCLPPGSKTRNKHHILPPPDYY